MKTEKITELKKTMNAWDYCDNFPPILCRLLARVGKYGRPLTTDEIAKRGGLTPMKVAVISELCNWSSVPVGEMRAFLRGCGFDFCNSEDMRRVSDYLRKNPALTYLRNSPEFKSYYKPLLIRWRDSWLQFVANGPPIYPPVASLVLKVTVLLKKWDKWDSPHVPDIIPAPDMP